MRVTFAMPVSDEKNTRRWPRMNIVLEVHMRFDDLVTAIDETVARTTNISREGLFIRVKAPKPVGTRVKVTFAVQARGQLVVEGEVVRSVPGEGMAIKIDKADDGWERYCGMVEHRRGELEGVDIDLD